MQEIRSSVSKEEIDRIINCDEANPSTILGPHFASFNNDLISFRAYFPRAIRALAES